MISGDCEACALGIFFFGFSVDNDAPVHNVAPTVCRQACFVNEEHFVRAGDLTEHALSESPNFYGIGVAVEFAVLWIFCQIPVFHEFSGFVV